MGYQIGSGYLATDSKKVSTANQELIVKPEGTTVYTVYKWSFKNYNECTVLVNNETRIFLDALDGFEVTHRDPPIYSFIIETPDVEYIFVGAHK
ncbi:hypothetical protein EVU96_09445 [Bacillus infantis]|uniref:hypothetical protein n=1 Tax=Bacillus infantis TaxID=324767 RepID=UPI00101B9165|nr:hypothetical protein [Bacillus infantis]RYI30630.1 hypothetical protein EVU96_09445 [Bacillus infantis]